MKSPVAKKLAVRHLCVRQLVFWLLVVSSFNYFQMHAWYTSMLLLLHSTFMLSVVNMLLKGEVGGRALISHGNYIVDHGKSWQNHGIVILNFCENPGINNNRATQYYPSNHSAVSKCAVFNFYTFRFDHQ